MASTGSANMRARQIYGQLATPSFSSLPLGGILYESRVWPWIKGRQFVWVKPKNWVLVWFASRRNRVLIDFLDSYLWDLPKWVRSAENIEFIVCTKRQRDLISRLYPKQKIHLIPHHYDPVLELLKISSLSVNSSVGYVGAKRKFVNTIHLDIDTVGWLDFIANPTRWKFHWAVRPSGRMFHPETKIATAARCGAIPIVSQGELGTLLPLDYPFCIDDVSCLEEVSRLKENMEDDVTVQFWQEWMKEIVAQTSLDKVAKSYHKLLAGGKT